jgi:hypothetical protein
MRLLELALAYYGKTGALAEKPAELLIDSQANLVILQPPFAPAPCAFLKPLSSALLFFGKRHARVPANIEAARRMRAAKRARLFRNLRAAYPLSPGSFCRKKISACAIPKRCLIKTELAWKTPRNSPSQQPRQRSRPLRGNNCLSISLTSSKLP